MDPKEKELETHIEKLHEERKNVETQLIQVREKKYEVQGKFRELSLNFYGSASDGYSWDTFKIRDDISAFELFYRESYSYDNDCLGYLEHHDFATTQEYIEYYEAWNKEMAKIISVATHELDLIDHKIGLAQKEVSEEKHTQNRQSVMDETYDAHLKETLTKTEIDARVDEERTQRASYAAEASSFDPEDSVSHTGISSHKALSPEQRASILKDYDFLYYAVSESARDFDKFERAKNNLIDLLGKEDITPKKLEKVLRLCLKEADTYLKYEDTSKKAIGDFIRAEASFMRGTLEKNLKDPESFIHQQHAIIRHVFEHMPFLKPAPDTVVQKRLVEAYQKRLEKYAAPEAHLTSDERDHHHNVVAMIQAQMISQGLVVPSSISKPSIELSHLYQDEDVRSEVVDLYQTYREEKDNLHEKNTHFQKMQMTSLHLMRSLQMDTVKKTGKPGALQRLFDSMEKKIKTLSHENIEAWHTHKAAFLDDMHKTLQTIHKDLARQEAAQDEKMKTVLDKLASLDPHRISQALESSKDRNVFEMSELTSFMKVMRSKVDEIKSDAQDVLKEAYKEIEVSQKTVRDAYSAYRAKSKDTIKNYRTLEDITRKDMKDDFKDGFFAEGVKEVSFFVRFAQFMAQAWQGLQERLGMRSVKTEAVSVDLPSLSPHASAEVAEDSVDLLGLHSSDHAAPVPMVDLDSVFSAQDSKKASEDVLGASSAATVEPSKADHAASHLQDSDHASRRSLK